MTRPHNGPSNLSVRRTMIKDTVGRVRKPAYDLPDSKDGMHSYGYEVKRDSEGAGQVMSKWVQATPSPAAASLRSFVETNRRSVAEGCVTAKDCRTFAKTRPEIREKKPQKKDPSKSDFKPSTDAVYGIKTTISENISGLIQAKHTTFENDDKDYPDLSTMTIKGKLPMPRETKASIGKDRRFQATDNNAEKKAFKIKKFEKIAGVLSTQPKQSKTMG